MQHIAYCVYDKSRDTKKRLQPGFLYQTISWPLFLYLRSVYIIYWLCLRRFAKAPPVSLVGLCLLLSNLRSTSALCIQIKTYCKVRAFLLVLLHISFDHIDRRRSIECIIYWTAEMCHMTAFLSFAWNWLKVVQLVFACLALAIGRDLLLSCHNVCSEDRVTIRTELYKYLWMKGVVKGLSSSPCYHDDDNDDGRILNIMMAIWSWWFFKRFT